MAHVSKLGIYNDALILLGQRALSSDTEAREPRYDLDNLYGEGGVDYCLEIVKPSFARKLVQLTGINPTVVTGFSWQGPIPSDFTAMVGLYADGKLEQPIEKFYREDNVLLSDFENPFLRYILDFETVGLADMTHSFARVVSAYFARELSVKYDPDSYADINKELVARIEILDQIEAANEPAEQSLTPTVLTTEWLAIYNDSLLILKQPPIAGINDDSIRKNRLDLARASKLVESVLEDNAWGFGSKSVQVFYDPGIDPDWGYQYVAAKPADLHRLDGVYTDEFYQYPLRDYIDEDGNIYSSYQTIYLEYVSTDFLTDPTLWPGYFWRLIAARMAVDAGGGIPGADLGNAVEQYKNRRKEAMSTDAMAKPPKTLTQGSWSRTRRELHSGRHDRP